MKHLLTVAIVLVTGMTAFGKPMTGSVTSWEGEFVLNPTNFVIQVAGKPTLTLWLYELKTRSAGGTAVGFSTEEGDMLLAPSPREKGTRQPIYQHHVVTFATNGNAEVVITYKIQGQGGQIYVEKYEYDGKAIGLTAKSVYGSRHDPVWHNGNAEEVSQPASKAPNAKEVSPEAQTELDQLNFKCANSKVWAEEFDRLERPETQPPDYLVSGECRAFAEDCKKRLASLGVRVKWNSDKKRYEVQK